MEWIAFLEAIFVSALVIYLPGLLLVRASHFTWSPSLAIAPIITGFFYVFAGLLFGFAGISISGLFLFLLILCLGCVVFGFSGLIHRLKTRKIEARYSLSQRALIKRRFVGVSEYISDRVPDDKRSALTILLYLAIGVCVTCFVFAQGIENPENFSREFDAAYHYPAIRGILDDGIFSILDVRTFPDIEASGVFYPALWHIIVAIVASITGIDLTICANAVIFVGLAFLFPLGIFGMLSWIFKDDRRVVIAGSIFALAFAAFPWGNLIYGQIVSNFYANAMIPSAILLFMVMLRSFQEKENRSFCVALFLMALITLVSTQPNSVFTAGIFCAVYLIRFCFDMIDMSLRIRNKIAAKVFACLGIVFIACCIWDSMFLISFIKQISIFNEFTIYSVKDAIIRSIFLSFTERIFPQFILAMLVWIGFFACMFTRGRRWLCFPFLIGLFIYVVSASCLGDFAHTVSGFWYNDPPRTAAMVCIFAIPLASFGFAEIIKWISLLLSRFVRENRRLKVVEGFLMTLMMLAFLPANYLLAIPYSADESDNINSFERLEYYFHRFYSPETNFILNGKQYEFVQDAEKIIEEDPGVVINIPYDGSGWLYGTDGLNTMYRTARSPEGSPLDSEKIRTDLNRYKKSKEVQDAVDALDAKYVLRLVPSNCKNGNKIMLSYYDPDEWKGINAISDDTAGFEPVLQDGDMRLYKIKR